MNFFCRAAVLCAGLATAPVFANTTIYEDRVNKQLADVTNGAHATGVSGESIDMRTGQIGLRHVDIDLPGNSALPVQLVRSFKTPRADGAFNDWDIELPNLSGIFALTVGWKIDGVASPSMRCSAAIGRSIVAPPYAVADMPIGYDDVGFYPEEYWHGYQFEQPGGGSTPLLLRPSASTRKPTDGRTYPWVASGDWMFYCIALPGSTTSEGFAGVSPQGVTYFFDVMTSSPAPTLQKYDDLLELTLVMRRKQVQLLPSKAIDRFGNWVTYSYSATHPGRVSKIEANDGRRIDIDYDTRGRIQSATAAGRTWAYAYEGNAAITTSNDLVLKSVTRPDGSQWTFDLKAIGAAHVNLTSCPPIGSIQYDWTCDPEEMAHPPGLPSNQLYAGTVWAPSGLRTDYQLKAIRPIQSLVSDSMGSPHPGLVQKTVSGPGVATGIWTYAYSHVPTAAWANGCGGPCPTSVESSYLDPSGDLHRFVHGVSETSRNHGLLLSTSITPAGSATPLQTTTYAYNSATTGQAFSPTIGSDPLGPYSPNTSLPGAVRPLSSTVIARDGATFSSVTAPSDFDEFARPLVATKSSSLGHSRIDGTVYHDNLTSWTLGQIKKTTTDGIVTSETSYDAITALPVWSKAFGKLQQTLGHYPDGTVATIKDGRNYVTTLSSWKRGIPQKITHADSKFESAVVNDDGTLASVTDENGAGYTTSYGYDLMGRLASIAYPAGDSTAWLPTTVTFERVAAAEYGIPAGHWKQTVSTGDARKVTYLDGMWRPLVEEAYDALNSAATLSQTVKRYDVDGHLVYQSYPMGGLTGYTIPTQGSRTFYDALDRVTRVEQDSEIGVLASTTEYLSGFQTRTTNPRLQSTTVSYLAHDQPTTDWPVAISHPEGAYTDIARDRFGKPTSLTRRNAGGTVASSRYYVYDEHQQLCKTLEPETASTVMSYDAAGNLDWSASGLSYPSITLCDTSEVPAAVKVGRGYDARNRLSALNFPYSNGSQSWTYTPDGLPSQVTTLNDDGNASAINTFSYNKRRLLTGESLQQPGLYTWSIGYGYNGNGHLATHSSPGLNVAYAPNALGQPTQAGTYATGVSYFPNGAMAQFTYGNGIVHTLDQNTRGLPERSRDAYGTAAAVHDDSYDYDANGNVLAISDGRAGARGNRDMTYDGLDRLKTTTSPMFAPASYSYDVLDNLTTVKIAGRDHRYYYDPSWRLTNVINPLGESVIGLDYDDQGNLKDKNGQLYRFDFGNRLREAVGKEKYRYDAHGRRIQATHETLDTIYSMYGNDGVLRYQEDYRKKEVVSYVYLNGSLVASVTTPANVTPAPTLSAPSSSGNGSFAVSWSTVPGASGYRLEESINSGAWDEVIDTPALSWNPSGKSNGSYRYRARSCHLGCSAYSAIVTVAVSLVPTETSTLTAPSYNTAGNYTVSWTSVALATTYELHEQINGGTWTLLQNIAAYSKAISGKPGGTYGYRVRGCNTAGCAPWSTTATVAVELPPAAPPVLTVPAQGLNGTYVVTWGTAAGATSYTLEESVNSGAWGVTYSGTAQSQAFSGRAAASYAYRVKSCNPAGCSGVSATDAVQVIHPPATAPTISAPSQGLNGAYTVSWNAVGGASSYRLEESANGAAWSLIQNTTALSRALTGKATGSYDYRVTACNAAGCSPISSSVSVQVIHPPGTATTPAAPALSSNGAYTVSWSAVSTANSYQLSESANGDAWVVVHNATTLSKALSGKVAGNYSYRVRACNAAGCGAESGIRAVQVTYPPSTAPALTAPDESTTGAYTVSWSAVSTATSYQLEESANSGTWTLIHNAAAMSESLSGKANGTFAYRVRACNAGGCGPISGSVSVQVLHPPGAASTPSAPAESYTGSYTVTWSAISTATSYRLEESINGGVWNLIHNAAATSKALSGKVAGDYSYRVRACNVAGCGVVSSTRAVEVILPPATAPAITVPTTSATGGFTVSWTAIATATSYQLQERLQGGGWALVHNAAGASKAITGKINGTYEYMVRACNAAGCGGYSTVKPIVVLLPPTTPSLSVYQVGFAACDASWSSRATATSYQLSMGTTVVYNGPGTSYYRSTKCVVAFTVRACNASGCSAPSAPVFAEPEEW